MVCDGCDAVMTRDGDVHPKKYAQADPDELAPHFEVRSDLLEVARSRGWTATGNVRCPSCRDATLT